MAESAVSFLLYKLWLLMEGKVKLLKGVRKEVKDIVAELESMQAFLKDADVKSEIEESVKTWVKQVRDVAYDMEDVLDECLDCIAVGRDKSTLNLCKLV
uniref:Disease resistance N-terminal domain-containing protein n=1 Tax=Nelumbo nucifera TaxID=4432 RepID=A0A822Z942_NELNU|nr:TPA_asm: hypothetical protein HUJ06_001054 [Nelumbo nucifera]